MAVYSHSGRTKLIDAAFSDPRLSAIAVSLEDSDTVSIRIDYDRIDVPNVSGEITITARTPKARTGMLLLMILLGIA